MCVRVHCPVDARTCTHIWKYTNTHSHSHTYCANTRTNAARTDPHAHAETHTLACCYAHTYDTNLILTIQHAHTTRIYTERQPCAYYCSSEYQIPGAWMFLWVYNFQIQRSYVLRPCMCSSVVNYGASFTFANKKQKGCILCLMPIVSA